MKTIPSARSNNGEDSEIESSLYLLQARYRETFWKDYRIEMELIGAWLRRLRIESGQSIESVARAIRIPAYRLYKIEHGLYLHFELRHFQKLSTLYGTTTQEVLSAIPKDLFDDTAY